MERNTENDIEKDPEKDLEQDLPGTASDTDQSTVIVPDGDDTTPDPAPPSQDPAFSPPPDGGLQAWLQVLGGFSVMVATWGLVNTFGVYQTYYETTLLAGRTSSSAISWIGSIQASLLLVLGLLSGPLYDGGWFRTTMTAGLFLIVLGMFMTSLATEYWQLILAQGVCVGLGMGLSFLPSTAILAQYFARRRALAIGVASTGSPLAGIVFPIIFSRLSATLGFGWATRVIAFIVLALSAVPVAFMRVRVPPPAKRALFDSTALADPAFMLFAAAGFASFLVLYVPFFYTQLYTIAHGVSDAAFAPYLVTFLNVGSVFGRVIPGAAADRYGALNTTIFCTLASAVLAFGWIGCADLGGLTVFALLYGAFSGGVVGLAPSVLVSLSPDMGRVGARMGMSFAFNGVAVLVGTPIAGAILGRSNWVPMIVFTGVFLAAGSVLYSSSRYFVFRKKGGLRA
ncbi:MFS general substrate transporter [Coniochaeta sp. PMI_546]|nr:MFS general substrate transporter [Coniochaeta sp. PMI_546]